MAVYEAVVEVRYNISEKEKQRVKELGEGNSIIIDAKSDFSKVKKDVAGLRDEVKDLKKIADSIGKGPEFEEMRKQVLSVTNEVKNLSSAVQEVQKGNKENAIIKINISELNNAIEFARTFETTYRDALDNIMAHFELFWDKMSKPPPSAQAPFDKKALIAEIQQLEGQAKIHRAERRTLDSKDNKSQEDYTQLLEQLSKLEPIYIRLIAIKSEFGKRLSSDVFTLEHGFLDTIKSEIASVKLKLAEFAPNESSIQSDATEKQIAETQELIEAKKQLAKVLADVEAHYQKVSDAYDKKNDNAPIEKDGEDGSKYDNRVAKWEEALENLEDKKERIGQVVSEIKEILASPVDEDTSGRLTELQNELEDYGMTYNTLTKTVADFQSINVEAFRAITDAAEQLPQQSDTDATALEKLAEAARLAAEEQERLNNLKTDPSTATNKATEEHIKLMEQAAQAEIEKLEVSKRLEKQLSNEERGFDKLGKAIDAVENKGKNRTVPSMSLNEFEEGGARVSTKPMTQATADMNKHKKSILDVKAAEEQRGQVAQNNAKIEVQQSKQREQAMKEEASAVQSAVKGEKALNDLIIQRVRLQKQVDDQRAALNKLDKSAEGYKEADVALSELIAAFDKLNEARGTEGSDAAMNTFLGELSRVKVAIADVKKEMSPTLVDGGDTQRLAALDRLIQEYNTMLSKWGAMKNDPTLFNQANANIGEIEQFIALVKDGGVTVEQYSKKISELRHAKHTLSAKTKEAGKDVHSFGEQVSRQMTKYASYITSLFSFHRIFSVFRNGWQYIKDIDAAMAELKMITDATGKAYDEFFSGATESAQRLGVKIDQLIKSTNSFIRLGYSFEDAGVLSEYATILSRVGQMDIGNATQALVSQMKAFNVEAENALRIVDLLTVSDANMSVTANDVAEGMKRSSAALAAANNTMEESVSMFNSVFAVLQNAEQSARCWLAA